jgi:adenosine deaminase
VSDFEKTNHYAIDGAFISSEEKEKFHAKLREGYRAHWHSDNE